MSVTPAFRALALPAWIEPPEAVSVELATGLTVEGVRPEPEWVARLAGGLRDRADALRARPVDEVVAALGTVGARFLAPADPMRAEALRLLPVGSGLSAPMCAAVLDGMATDWTAERLAEGVRRELGDPAALDGFVSSGPGGPGGAGRRRAVGPSLCVQILAGSVPGVGVTALIRSLLAKGPTLLKPGLGDAVLPALFARALAEHDPELASACAVLYWPRDAKGAERAALGAAEVAVAYGGDATVERVRAALAPTGRLVAYHHRVSVGVVGRDAPPGTTRAVARAVALFDRRGCVSPQVLYVERGGPADPERFARDLADELAALETTLPGGVRTAGDASALHQLRGTLELLAEEADDGLWLAHGGEASWTVLLAAPDPGVRGVGRYVRVEPVDDAFDVIERVRPLARHLQSVGITGLGDRLPGLAEALSGVGATRIASFEALPFPPPWWSHDGVGGLTPLLRWVDLEA